jgi:hypothetical protein
VASGPVIEGRPCRFSVVIPAFACPLREMLAITEGYEQVVGYDGHGYSSGLS